MARPDRTTVARTRITAVLAGASVAAGVVAIAMWSYLLVRDGLRAGVAELLALTIVLMFGALIVTIRGGLARNSSTARRRIAAILLGFGLLVNVGTIAIWSYVLLRDGYRVEIAGILILMVSIVLFFLCWVSQLARRDSAA